MKIGNHELGASAPFIIAELSGNHGGSVDRALKMVDAAAEAGAHAVKLQTFTADTMTLDVEGEEFRLDPAKPASRENSMYGFLDKFHTPWEWHEPIMNRCQERGILAFSSPFDATAVDFLESLEVPCHKIASFENVDIPLIEKAASTGKPLILSTGMATIAELDEAVRAARSAGCKDLVILKCTSNYPASPENSNILTIPHLRQLFNCEVGLSDHTLGIGVPIAAVALGATVIEKHFTLDRNDGGVDSVFSLEPHDLKSLVMESERAWQSLGRVAYGPGESELNAATKRRSLYIARDMEAGEVFTEENLRSIRPGLGLPPKYLSMLMGKRVARAVKKGTPMSWDLL